MKHSRRAPRHDQAAIRSACEFADGAFDLVGAAYIDGEQLHPERRRHGLDGTQLTESNRNLPQNCHACYAGCDLFEQLQPFPGDAEFNEGETGDIAARVGQTGNETLTHRVADDNRYDRDGSRLPLESAGHWCRVCENGVRR